MSSLAELQRELKDLQDENKEILKGISLNADAQEVALIKEDHLNYLSDENKDTLMKCFLYENDKLRSLIDQMTKDRNQAQSKAILIQQQSEENESFKMQLRTQLEQRIKEIGKILYEKESIIQRIESDKSAIMPQTSNNSPISHPEFLYSEMNSLMVHREVLVPSIATFKIHEETEVIRKEITKAVQQIEILTQRKKKNVQSTKNIQFQIEQLQNCIRQPHYKKRNCMTQQQETFSDDEDYNLSHCSKKVDDFLKEKIRKQIAEERKALLKRGQLRNGDLFTWQGALSVRTQKLPQIEAEAEKLKTLAAIWRENNEKRVAAIQKMQRYNQTLEKSNEQLIANYKQLQQKTTDLNDNLKLYKESYQNLIHKKKQTQLLNQQPSSQQQSTRPTTGTPSKTIPQACLPSQLANQTGSSLLAHDYAVSPLVNLKNIKEETKDLRSVEEEEVDEDIAHRRTLTNYKLQGVKGSEEERKFRGSHFGAAHNFTNMNPGDFYFDESVDRNPFPGLHKRKACIMFLYKIKQQLDRICRRRGGFAVADPIPPSDPKFISVSTIPPPMFRVERSFSDSTDCTEKRDSFAVWSLQKRPMQHCLQKDVLSEDSADNDIYLNCVLAPPAEPHLRDFINHANDDESVLYLTTKKLENQQAHNNSFFRELDISVIHKPKK